MNIIHDSRDQKYRIPFGAVNIGTDILISISASDLNVKRVYIEVRRDDSDRYKRVRIAEREKGKYSVKLKAPKVSCLIWYRFRIEAELDDGIHTLYYCNNDKHLGGVGRVIDLTGDTEFSVGTIVEKASEGRLAPYQITVYRRAEVPEWYRDGIVYQIFPDRFARDEDWEARCEEAVKFVNERREDTKRIIEHDWYKPAYYERGENNKVTGWPIYGGSLNGIREKLEYLKSLGVSVIYLNPIFKATSNHRYDTGNYMKVDRALGTEAEFVELAKEAKEKGIRIILDGVFSHTGADSIYFDRYGNYGGGKKGAWQGEDSPYRSWYKFDDSEPCGYKSWWGVEDLPEVDEMNRDYQYYILSKDGVAAHWLKLGASGWRLDVADELPDAFIKAMRARIKVSDPESVLIGEVWEDASNKISYGERRQYFAGDELDGTMNYPLRSILLDYINYTISAGEAGNRFMSLAENYPRENFYAALNLIGSHDRERVMTMMAAEKDKQSAVSKVKVLSALQYALPGVPCIYYGDEAGLTGNADPENRSAFPWGEENQDLEYHYRMLGLIYDEHPVLKNGSFKMFSGDAEDPGDDILMFLRADKNECILVVANRSYGDADVDLGSFYKDNNVGYALDLLTSEVLPLETVVEEEKADEAEEDAPDEASDAEAAAEVTEESSADVPETEADAETAEDTVNEAPEAETAADESAEEKEEVRKSLLHMKALSVRFIYLMEKPPETEDLGRDSGVICHISSLGERALGRKAEDFVDYLVRGNFGIWQVLPLNPLGLGNSPYVSKSAFAGEPSYISREITFRKAAQIESYDEFLTKNDEWLTEYITFTVIQEMQDGKPWYEWPNEYKFADPHKIMRKLLRLNPGRIRELEKEQYLFHVEWQKLKRYANGKGIRIMGDIPMYVGYDSCDVWANKDIFQLDQDGRMKAHAGVPPDYFSKDGQDWGNPLYDWEALKKTGYDWWMRRIKQCQERYDILRIDHFRALSEYYAVPEGSKPVDGKWHHGPGLSFIKAIKSMLTEECPDDRPELKLLAEDLGQLDSGVLNLIKLSGLPGMNVWQFNVWEMMNMPEEEAKHRAFYSGTHDKDTLVGFFRKLEGKDTDESTEAPGGDKEESIVQDSAVKQAKDAIRKIYESPAALAMVQLQDVFMLGSEARMNIPGLPEGNWTWRIPGDSIKDAFPDSADNAAWFRSLAEETGRA